MASTTPFQRSLRKGKQSAPGGPAGSPGWPIASTATLCSMFWTRLICGLGAPAPQAARIIANGVQNGGRADTASKRNESRNCTGGALARHTALLGPSPR